MTGRAPIVIRAAQPRDIPVLGALIVRSARALGRGYYTPAETEAAIAHVFGVDSELVADGTYLVAWAGEHPVGCGGWSRRRTLFGGDRFAARDAAILDPATDAARIRAFFVDPDRARGGVGSALLAACEAAAREAGFGRAALMATLPGIPFYLRHGYEPGSETTVRAGEVTLRFMPMSKPLDGELRPASALISPDRTQRIRNTYHSADEQSPVRP